MQLIIITSFRPSKIRYTFNFIIDIIVCIKLDYKKLHIHDIIKRRIIQGETATITFLLSAHSTKHKPPCKMVLQNTLCMPVEALDRIAFPYIVNAVFCLI